MGDMGDMGVGRSKWCLMPDLCGYYYPYRPIMVFMLHSTIGLWRYWAKNKVFHLWDPFRMCAPNPAPLAHASRHVFYPPLPSWAVLRKGFRSALLLTGLGLGVGFRYGLCDFWM